MKICDELYASIKEIWDSYEEHPFVKGIVDGTLPVEKFQYYMIQDHKYLMQYAKVFALGVLKAKDEADMRTFANLITATLDTENAVHQAYINRLGLDNNIIAETPTHMVTESYTNYMISISLKEGLGELMTAVLACSWSYKLIGDYIEKKTTAREHPFYGSWASMYSSEPYRKSNKEMMELVEKYCKDYNKDQIDNLKHIIKMCSEYEYMFWDMAWNSGK